MLTLADPMDSAQNNGLRLHDVSLFQNKYYLYFGPTPAVTLFIPVRLLGLGKLTEPYAVWLFSVGAFLSAAIALSRLFVIFKVNVSLGLYGFVLCVLGFLGPLAYTLRHPFVYEVAITAGAFYGGVGFVCLLGGWKDGRPSKRGVALTSLFWGMAVGCRPNLVIFGALLFLIWYSCFRQKGAVFGKESVLNGGLIGGPFALVVLCLLSYNQARFGSAGEFGASFQLSGNTMVERGFHQNQFSLINLPLNAYNAVLNLPTLKAYFPFIEASPGYTAAMSPGRYFASEPVVGMIWSNPVVALGVLLLVACFLKMQVFRSHGERLHLVILGYGVLPLLFSLWLIPGITMRYLVDYSFALSVFGCFGVAISMGWVSGNGKRLLGGGYMALAMVGGVVSVCLGFTGYYNLYKQAAPGQFFELADRFKWVERMLLPNSPVGRVEVLDVIAPSGVTLLEDRSTAMLLGPSPIFIRVTSPSTVGLLMQFKTVPAGEAAGITISSGTWSSEIAIGKTVESKSFTLQLEKGMNLIKVTPSLTFQHLNGPVCGLTGLNFSLQKP